MTPKVILLQHTQRVSTPVEHVQHSQEGPMSGSRDVATVTPARLETTASRLRELVAHLRHQRAQLREEWARLITEAKLLTAMTKEELFAEATSVYDNYVDALDTVTYEALQAYARNLSERIIPRGVETHEVVGIVLLLRDVLARSLFATYHEDFNKLNRILDAYEPAANRIAATVAVGFVQERERIIREQQEAIRELSTPVLQVRERLLILPIIGVIDPQRAHLIATVQSALTDEDLKQLRDTLVLQVSKVRARGVIVDVTALDVIDSFATRTLRDVAYMIRLRGAETVIVGIQPEVAFSMVKLGLTLEGVATSLDLEEGLAYLDRMGRNYDQEVRAHRSAGARLHS